MADNINRTYGLSLAAFIGALAHEIRRADEGTGQLMQSATGEKPKMWGPSIIGFGGYPYRYESGREGDAQLAGF